MKKPYLLLSLVALLGLGPMLRATTMIYPVAAIEDLWNLAADDFRQKYAGINASGLGPSDEGWYVRYRHENLTYLFGPLKEREDARLKKWDLEAVRDAAIRNRATISGSQVDYVRFTYSGVFGKGGGNTPYRGKAGGKDGGDGEGDGEGGKDGSGKDGSGADGAGKDGNGKDGSGKDGKGDGAGGDGQGEKLAGLDGGDGGDGAGGEGGQKGGKGGKKGSKSGKGGQSGDGGDGDDGDSGGQAGSSGKSGGQKVASNKSGSKSGSQGGQQGGQSGSGQQGSQSGQQGGQSGQQGGSSGGQSGQPGGSSGAPSSGGQGGGGNPLDMVVGLLRKILGL